MIKLNFFLCSAILISLAGKAAYATGTDPLSPTELQTAQTLASVQHRSSQKTPIELLLVERRINGKDQQDQRLADVYHYDYNTNETIHSVVDLDTQQSISSKRQQYVQLPLTEKELQRTNDIIFADPEESMLIKNEYQRITGQYLSSPEQLNIKAFSFSSDTLPEQLNPASQKCGLHRCAQVLLYTHDAVVFEISPIVNLSEGLVTQNIGY